jgi:hypothetical protein
VRNSRPSGRSSAIGCAIGVAGEKPGDEGAHDVMPCVSVDEYAAAPIANGRSWMRGWTHPFTVEASAGPCGRCHAKAGAPSLAVAQRHVGLVGGGVRGMRRVRGLTACDASGSLRFRSTGARTSASRDGLSGCCRRRHDLGWRAAICVGSLHSRGMPCTVPIAARPGLCLVAAAAKGSLPRLIR